MMLSRSWEGTYASANVSFQFILGSLVDWAKPGEELKFKTKGQSTNVDLAPLNQVMDQLYTVYFKVIPKSA